VARSTKKKKLRKAAERVATLGLGWVNGHPKEHAYAVRLLKHSVPQPDFSRRWRWGNLVARTKAFAETAAASFALTRDR
jgi:hypothetical protein